MQQSTPYLSFRGITMTFPGVKALSDISFDCYPGQILSLIHISEPTRLGMISYAVFCLKKKKKKHMTTSA